MGLLMDLIFDVPKVMRKKNHNLVPIINNTVN